MSERERCKLTIPERHARITYFLRCVTGDHREECWRLARGLEDEEIDALKYENQTLKHLLERLMTLGEKAIALAADDVAKTKQVGDLTVANADLQTQLTAAQENQLPAGFVPIEQAGADAINGAVGDDASIPPKTV